MHSGSHEHDNHLPELAAKDVFGKEVDFGKIDDDYVLLVFLRYSGCPWCNLAIHRLTLENKELKANKCQVIAFVQSDTQNIISNIYDRHHPRPQFPIIPDPKMVFYNMYDVKPSVPGMSQALLKIPYWFRSVKELGYNQTKIDGNFFLVPAWFLVSNITGKIVKSQRGISLYDHEAFLDIYDSLYYKDR
jgi:thioredoxin-dependent peroxiredoxin